jgi:hypothetical protein
MKKRKFLELVNIILIALFFAIPLCSLVMNEWAIRWPIHATRFIYYFLLK